MFAQGANLPRRPPRAWRRPLPPTNLTALTQPTHAKPCHASAALGAVKRLRNTTYL